MENHQINLDDVTAVSELHFEPLDKKYKSAHIVGTAITYLIMMALGLFVLLTDCMPAFIAAECVIAATATVNLVLLTKAYAFKGYAMRDRDITYRSGIIFPKTTTIPYARVQQVSIRQNPVSRYFGLYAIEIVNGAQQLSSTTIPGLPEETAGRIKELIAEKLGDSAHD